MSHHQEIGGLRVQHLRPDPNVRDIVAVNKNAGSITEGMVQCIDPTAAYHGGGQSLPTVTTTDEDNALVAGVVAPDQATIPTGAEYMLRVSGLHPSVLCDGGTNDLANGDEVCTGAANAAAVKKQLAGGGRLGVYVDAAYTSATAAAKAVFLTNNLGLPAMEP